MAKEYGDTIVLFGTLGRVAQIVLRSLATDRGIDYDLHVYENDAASSGAALERVRVMPNLHNNVYVSCCDPADQQRLAAVIKSDMLPQYTVAHTVLFHEFATGVDRLIRSLAGLAEFDLFRIKPVLLVTPVAIPSPGSQGLVKLTHLRYPNQSAATTAAKVLAVLGSRLIVVP